MRLVPYWAFLLRRAWSLRLIALAAALTATEAGLALVDAQILGLPRGSFAVLSALASAGAFAARLIAQKGITHADDH